MMRSANPRQIMNCLMQIREAISFQALFPLDALLQHLFKSPVANVAYSGRNPLCFLSLVAAMLYLPFSSCEFTVTIQTDLDLLGIA
jgi:hypothetical protein